MPQELEQLGRALADRYHVKRELGRGGMAIVYLAQDLKHQREVAIKILRPELAAGLGPERFVREIAITAGLSHPNILTRIDSGEAGGFVYYVLKFVEGESLRRRLERGKQLPIDNVVRICREAADALSHAHDWGIVHRDIKPENILLQSGHAVVSDFGIARAVLAAAGDAITETGIAVGTPAGRAGRRRLAPIPPDWEAATEAGLRMDCEPGSGAHASARRLRPNSRLSR